MNVELSLKSIMNFYINDSGFKSGFDNYLQKSLGPGDGAHPMYELGYYSAKSLMREDE